MLLMEEKKRKEKEMLEFKRDLLKTVKQLTSEIGSTVDLSNSEKDSLYNSIKNLEGLEDLKKEVRLDEIRKMNSFKDYQVFLAGEKLRSMNLLESQTFIQEEMKQDSGEKLNELQTHIEHLGNSFKSL